MKIHEYQAKELMAKYGIPVPRGGMAASPDDARRVAEELGGSVVVKAQVHAGGRGKAGGVKVVDSPDAAAEFTGSILGKQLVTFQTGPEGVPVNSVLVEETMDIAQELYVAIVLDPSERRPVVIASAAGGMEIEEVAEATPEKILRAVVDPTVGLQPYQGRALAYGIGVPAELVRPAADLIVRLYRLMADLDCSQVEINPLVVTGDGRVLPVDAKLNLDDDAMFRHKDLTALRDASQEDPLESQAHDIGVIYVRLDGDVGCLVNGAGLAMATMDIVTAVGAAPANFLDVGGGADEDRIRAAVRILLSDPNVKRVLVNIFGGILRNDVLARGLVGAYADTGSKAPIIARMLGTNVDEGRQILRDSGLDVTVVETLKDAAEALSAA
ncbi:MAG: ADP-forming succinate--CoA ligase subunit beta [Chloroflexota bacterium]|nr:ADP-forming succinate--CoA ligase subunit beta [Chloroflexota bacterium]MDE2968801.1 ADP-forming succinate--CoA ligase subunit beta [Chloroflexota bacterium]